MDMDRHGRRKSLSIYPQLTKPHHVLIDEPSTAFQVNFVLRPPRATGLKKFSASRFCYCAPSFSLKSVEIPVRLHGQQQNELADDALFPFARVVSKS